MKPIVRILFILAMWSLSINIAAQDMRPYYHSFNSAPPKNSTLQPASRIANHTNAIYDSTYFYIWDTIAGNWQIKGKTINKSFDPDKNLLCMIGKTFAEGDWKDSYKYNYTYDHNNNITSKCFYTWQGAWIKLKNEVYTYNTHNDLLSYTVTQFNGSTWDNVEKDVFVYDSKYNKIKESYMNGSGSTWTNNYQYLYEYDSANNRLNEIYQLGTDSTWRNIAKWDYLYDSNHNRLSENYMNWENGAYVNAALYLYTYDSSNNFILKQISQNWENEAWENSTQTTYAYDEKYNKTKEFVERWNSSNWENRLQTIFTYDKKNNNTSTLMQEFITDKWTNVSNLKYVYDAAKHQIESVEQEWKNDVWNNREKLTYTYNSNGDQTMETSFKWKYAKWTTAYYSIHAFDSNFALADESHKSWNIITVDNDNNNNYPPFITGDSTHYYVHKDIATGQDEFEQIAKDYMIVYPNPSTGIFNVSLGGQQVIQNLEVYDSTGKLILKQKESNTVSIPGSLPGIYYIKLEHNSTQYSKRIIVQ